MFFFRFRAKSHMGLQKLESCRLQHFDCTAGRRQKAPINIIMMADIEHLKKALEVELTICRSQPCEYLCRDAFGIWGAFFFCDSAVA